MASGVDPQFSAELQKLYLTKLRERLATLETILPRLSRGSPRLADFETLERECHRLSGTGTTYGFPEITLAASPVSGAIRNGSRDFGIIAELLRRLIVSIRAVLPTESAEAEPVAQAEPDRPSVPPASATTRRPLLLIADDDPAIRDLLVELLMNVAVVQCASSGRETMEAIRKRRFDAVLLDLEMPDLDGLQILSSLRPMLDSSQTAVMMVTAHRDAQNVSQLLQAGARDYIVKPFVPQNLVRRVKALLGPRTPTVLLADDDPLVRAIIRGKLQQKGVGVLLAGNGSEALAMAQQARPDLIVLDGAMPRMDGLDVLVQIRRDLCTRAIPVLLLSARSEDADIAEGLRCGADDYIPKPFLPDDIVARCMSFLHGQLGNAAA